MSTYTYATFTSTPICRQYIVRHVHPSKFTALSAVHCATCTSVQVYRYVDSALCDLYICPNLPLSRQYIVRPVHMSRFTAMSTMHCATCTSVQVKRYVDSTLCDLYICPSLPLCRQYIVWPVYISKFTSMSTVHCVTCTSVHVYHYVVIVLFRYLFKCLLLLMPIVSPVNNMYTVLSQHFLVWTFK